jgi:hypothetical protein
MLGRANKEAGRQNPRFSQHSVTPVGGQPIRPDNTVEFDGFVLKPLHRDSASDFLECGVAHGQNPEGTP